MHNAASRNGIVLVVVLVLETKHEHEHEDEDEEIGAYQILAAVLDVLSFVV